MNILERLRKPVVAAVPSIVGEVFLIPGREALGLDLIFKELEKKGIRAHLSPDLRDLDPDQVRLGARWVFYFGSTPMEFRRLKECVDKVREQGVSPERILILVSLPEEKAHSLSWSWEDELGIPVSDFRLSLARYSRWEMRGEPDCGPLPPKIRQRIGDFISEAKKNNSVEPSDARRAAIEKKAKETLKNRIWDLAQKGTEGSFSWGQAVQQESRGLFQEAPFDSLPAASRDRIIRKMILYFSDFGPMTPLMSDEGIAEIMVNGSQKIFFEKDGRLHPHPESFVNDQHLKWVIDKLVRASGRRVDYSTPLCDFRLPGGARANVVFPPVSHQGPVLTIRKFQRRIHSMDDLIERKSLTRAQAEHLIRLVSQRKNLVVAGNSGAGKTTLLNILSGYIANEERVITVEDTAELNLQRSHVVGLEMRRSNSEGKGEVSLTDLVVNALRMRPDRLVIGEVRGAEVVPMIQALNTGHRGSLTTVHANSAEDALIRLETLTLLGAPQWPAESVNKLIRSAFDAVIFVKRLGKHRRVEAIVELHPEE